VVAKELLNYSGNYRLPMCSNLEHPEAPLECAPVAI
jgi:hypothetical protein